MYESKTFEGILEDMLNRVPDDMDKREGSIIYDAIAPCAVELTLMYIELDNILKETFGDTASREFLIRRAKERAIEPYEASFAILQGEFNIDIEIGERFSCYDLNYVAVEKISDCIYKMECETSGVVGNRYFGDLIPINYINGLTYAKLTKLLIPAEDEEGTEEFRARYFNTFNNKAYGGNITDYLEKTNAISGVGGCKVTPVWNGGGTVKVTVVDSNFKKATNVLVDTVQEVLDPESTGLGYGVAPIGHIVTVDTVCEVGINIETSIVFDNGYSFEGLEGVINALIEEYLQEEREKWANQGSLIIRIAYIEAKILGVDGVLDIGNTKINGKQENLSLGSYEIPILGGVAHV